MGSCPTDGTPLSPVRVAGAPPFMCERCSRGYWPAELTAQARALWNPMLRCFPASPEGDAIREAAEFEHETQPEPVEVRDTAGEKTV